MIKYSYVFSYIEYNPPECFIRIHERLAWESLQHVLLIVRFNVIQFFQLWYSSIEALILVDYYYGTVASTGYNFLRGRLPVSDVCVFNRQYPRHIPRHHHHGLDLDFDLNKPKLDLEQAVFPSDRFKHFCETLVSPWNLLLRWRYWLWWWWWWWWWKALYRL